MAKPFFAPDDGGGSSGAAGAASGQSADGAGQVELDPKLFDSLPLDELDDDTRQVIEKIKTGAIATLQRQQTLTQEVQKKEAEARKFQSEFDKSQAALAKLDPQRQNQPPNDPILTAVEKQLSGFGYSPEEIKKLGPVFAGMFKEVGTVQRTELGKDLQPLASSVLSAQATNAFNEATANDPLEMLKIPEVAEKTWAIVKGRVGEGLENSAEIVLNFAKMVWADHQLANRGKTGSTPTPPNLPATPPNMSTGFSYPGSGGISSIASPTRDTNAPRHELNDDTARALGQSFGSMLKGFEGKIPVPSGLKNIMTPIKRGARN